MQKVLDFNNTFLGRFTVGPLVMFVGFAARDMQLMQAGDRKVMRAWAYHSLGIVAVLTWTWGVCGVPSGSIWRPPISACRS